MLKSKLGTVESIMLIVTIVVAHTMLSLPRNLLVSTKSATIINLIYVSIIAIFISYLIFKLLKKFPALDIIDISEIIGGKIFKNIIGIIFISYFIISASMLLRNFCECLKVVYYPMTDITFILLAFIIAVCVANKLDFSATLKTNLIIIPFVLFSMIFLFFANAKSFTPERIFPILGDGIFNTFITGIGNIVSFSGIVFIYFIPPYLKEPEKLKKIALISTGLSATYLILSVSTILFMFSSFIISNEVAPLYNAARHIEFGKFFQRLESIFLLFWILSFACYLSIITKFSMNIFKKITNIKTKKPLIDIFGLLIFAIALFPDTFAASQYFETKIYPYLVLSIVFALGITILILANILSNKSKKSTNHLKG